MGTDANDDRTPGEIHVVERGDGWEVWRHGDSMPLGTYVTRAEADQHAADQSELDGSTVVVDDLPVDPTPEAER